MLTRVQRREICSRHSCTTSSASLSSNVISRAVRSRTSEPRRRQARNHRNSRRSWASTLKGLHTPQNYAWRSHPARRSRPREIGVGRAQGFAIPGWVPMRPIQKLSHDAARLRSGTVGLMPALDFSDDCCLLERPSKSRTHGRATTAMPDGLGRDAGTRFRAPDDSSLSYRVTCKAPTRGLLATYDSL